MICELPVENAEATQSGRKGGTKDTNPIIEDNHNSIGGDEPISATYAGIQHKQPVSTRGKAIVLQITRMILILKTVHEGDSRIISVQCNQCNNRPTLHKSHSPPSRA